MDKQWKVTALIAVVVFAGWYWQEKATLRQRQTPEYRAHEQAELEALRQKQAQDLRNEVIEQAWLEVKKGQILRDDPSSPYYRGNK